MLDQMLELGLLEWRYIVGIVCVRVTGRDVVGDGPENDQVCH